MVTVRNLAICVGLHTILRRITVFFAAIKFQETAFALPFAYTGMILAADGIPMWRVSLWITLGMVGARTFGMVVNRLFDRHIDALNPRTSGRHLPIGSIKVSEMAILGVLAAIILFVAAAKLNQLSLMLAPVAVCYLVIYPFTKRFTWAANIILGWALAIAPSAAWIGVRGTLSWEPVLLSAAVAFWAGSFDILYHIQDREFYVLEGLKSIAQRFGVPAAFRWARIMDVCAMICLVTLGVWMNLAFVYFFGCFIVALLLFYKYRLLASTGSSGIRMGTSFFRINAYVSATVLFSTVLSVVVVG